MLNFGKNERANRLKIKTNYKIPPYFSIQEEVATLRKSKFATLRSAKLISREQEEYNKVG